MSAIYNITNDDNEANEQKLSLVIRKPQEGKTWICITSIIMDTTMDVHIVLTMNTLASGMQFFGRMEEKIGCKNIIVYNSKKETAGNCLYAKTSNEVMHLLKKNKDIKVIVCCAHKTRFSESLYNIFSESKDSVIISYEDKRKFKIHIDEAHKYIPENREQIRSFNNDYNIVSKITGYSASPDPIFVTDKYDSLFNNIHVCDVEKEYNIISSNEYFGVKDTIPNIIEKDIDTKTLLENFAQEYSQIPSHIINYSKGKSCIINENDSEMNEIILSNKYWYGEIYPFTLGNEILYFAYLQYILPKLNISQSEFSYNFVPSYLRKVSHYQTAELILKYYNNANVIIINSNDIQLFRSSLLSNPSEQTETSNNINSNIKLTLIGTKKDIIIRDEIHKKQLLEPSFVIQSLIEDYKDCPTFVSGLMCVGMSVTLINQYIGNFNNVIIAHQHYNKEDLYQLCRFLFTYSNWSIENKEKIKKTNFISLTQEVYDICCDYEKYIEKIKNEYSGKTCTLNEMRNIVPLLPSESEIRKRELKEIEYEWGWKQFVIDGDDVNDDNLQWRRAENFYYNKSDKKITSKSKPSPDKTDPSFYVCAINGKKERYTATEINKKIEGNKTWDSYFQLLPGKTKYASRMLIGYHDIDNSKKYTIYIKWALLEDSEKVMTILNKYGKSTKKKQNSDTDN